jgi:hypothetical protein
MWIKIHVGTRHVCPYMYFDQYRLLSFGFIFFKLAQGMALVSEVSSL